MPGPQVVFIRGDVPNKEYQEALKDLFGDKKYPTIRTDDPKYLRLTDLADELDIEDSWKVFQFGSNSMAFRKFQSSPSFKNYRMAHLD